MVESANLWKGNNLACFGALDRPVDRAVLTQGQMSARAVVVVKIGCENALKVPLVDDDQVVEAFPPDRAVPVRKATVSTADGVFRRHRARFRLVWLSAPPCRTARLKNTGGRPRHIRRGFPVRLTADSTRRTIPELSGATGCPSTPSRPYHPPGSWGARPMAAFSYITRDADLQRATIGD